MASSASPDGSGMVLCIGGPPGAGKTSVGAVLARRLGWALADLDSVTTPLMAAVAAERGLPLDLQIPALAALRDARYECLAAVCRDNLLVGTSVIATAPFTAEATDVQSLAAWRTAVAGGTDARVTLAWLDVDATTAAQRRLLRGADRDAAGREVKPVDPVAADLVVAGGAGVESVADDLWRHLLTSDPASDDPTDYL